MAGLSRRGWLLAAAGVLLAGMVVAALVRSEDSPGSLAVDCEVADPPVVVVNSVTLPESAIVELQGLLRALPSSGLDSEDRESVIDYFIDGELLRQEAALRNLLPTEAEVTAEVGALQGDVQKVASTGDVPAPIQAMIDARAAAGYPLANWTQDPALRKAFGNMIIREKLRREVTQRPADADKDFAALQQRLRDAAEITFPCG